MGSSQRGAARGGRLFKPFLVSVSEALSEDPVGYTSWNYFKENLQWRVIKYYALNATVAVRQLVTETIGFMFHETDNRLFIRVSL